MSNEIVETQLILDCIPPSSADELALIARFEEAALQEAQAHVFTTHKLHGGMYARTVLLTPGTVLTGALVKIPTIVIVQGYCVMRTDGVDLAINGYNVFSADAGRKQVFISVTETYITMIFPTAATNVEQAEREFTDEYEKLMTRRGA